MKFCASTNQRCCDYISGLKVEVSDLDQSELPKSWGADAGENWQFWPSGHYQTQILSFYTNYINTYSERVQDNRLVSFRYIVCTTSPLCSQTLRESLEVIAGTPTRPDHPRPHHTPVIYLKTTLKRDNNVVPRRSTFPRQFARCTPQFPSKCEQQQGFPILEHGGQRGWHRRVTKRFSEDVE